MHQDERPRSSSRDEGPSTSYANFQLPVYRDTSRFSTTYSFYEFIDQELREEEERDMLILRIRENIIGSIVDELYDRYMDRQVIPFTVRCFEQSMRRLLNWYFLPRDPEDSPMDWEEDQPIAPVPVDNWASFCVSAGNYPPPVKFKFKQPFEEDELEGEEFDELDWPNFTEVVGEEIDTGELGSQSQFSDVGEMRRSKSEGGSISVFSQSSRSDDDRERSKSAEHEFERMMQRQPSQSKPRRAHFATVTTSDRSIKSKREIYQWISPKNFPPVRVTPGLHLLPGEKFSGKTCGRRVNSKTITVRPVKPTFINSKGEEKRSYTF